MTQIAVLASDMDGTFIPLEGHPENISDLKALCKAIKDHDLDLVYVTGRHYELVLDAIGSHGLPSPEWLICDVGTSIYQNIAGDRHSLLGDYHQHLASLVGQFTVQKLAEHFADFKALRLQEDEKQGPYKLSYYCDAGQIETLADKLRGDLRQADAPYRLIASVDPFNGDGLIDFLPRSVSKDYALRWWVRHTGRDDESVVFAGDSGNDLAALTAGYRSIVVGNADPSIHQQADLAHQAAGWTGRLFRANASATSGVLEGLRYYLKLAD